MAICKRITLRLHCNTDKYKITVCDENYRGYTIIKKKNDCLCFFTNSRFLKVTASPLSGNFNSTIFIKIDTLRESTVDVYLRFINTNNYTKDYTFYLLDSTYGLKIDGNLFFTKTV